MRKSERPDEIIIEFIDFQETVSLEEIRLVQIHLGNIIIDVLRQASLEEEK